MTEKSTTYYIVVYYCLSRESVVAVVYKIVLTMSKRQTEPVYLQSNGI